MVGLKKKHFHQQAKQKAVEFLRTEPRQLRSIAWVLNVSASSLSGWNGGFDDDMKPYVVSDQRGKAGKVTIEVVRKVVDTARTLKAKNRRLRLKDFPREMNNQLPIALSKKTIEQILIANDLWKTSTRRKRPQFYQNLCQRIPNGLLSLDGSELVVWIDDLGLKFNVELAVDVGSFCHTGYSIDRTETAEAIIRAIEQHRDQWGNPLGVIYDHGRANLSDDVMGYLNTHGIESVPVGPANPKGNGTDEGAFSQMKKTLGTIRLNTSSPQALGRSILQKLIEVYVTMRNQMALRKNEITPLSQMQIPATEAQRQMERQRLVAHKESRKKTPSDPYKTERLHWIVQHHGLILEPPALKRAEECIQYYDVEVIAKSEQAFLKAVNRKSERRTIAYFFGILKNIQQEVDDDSYQLYCRERYNHDTMLKNQRRHEQQHQEQALPTVAEIVNMATEAATASVRYVKELALKKVREWLQELVSSASYIGPIKKQIIDAIGSLKHIDLNQQEQVWNLIEAQLNQKPNTESVTLVS